MTPLGLKCRVRTFPCATHFLIAVSFRSIMNQHHVYYESLVKFRFFAPCSAVKTRRNLLPWHKRLLLLSTVNGDLSSSPRQGNDQFPSHSKPTSLSRISHVLVTHDKENIFSAVQQLWNRDTLDKNNFSSCTYVLDGVPWVKTQRCGVENFDKQKFPLSAQPTPES